MVSLAATEAPEGIHHELYRVHDHLRTLAGLTPQLNMETQESRRKIWKPHGDTQPNCCLFFEEYYRDFFLELLLDRGSHPVLNWGSSCKTTLPQENPEIMGPLQWENGRLSSVDSETSETSPGDSQHAPKLSWGSVTRHTNPFEQNASKFMLTGVLSRLSTNLSAFATGPGSRRGPLTASTKCRASLKTMVKTSGPAWQQGTPGIGPPTF